MKIGNQITLSCEVRPCANYQGVSARVDIPITLEVGDTIESAIESMGQVFRALQEQATQRLKIMTGRADEIPAAPLPILGSAPEAPVMTEHTLLSSSTEVEGDTTIEKLLSCSLEIKTAAELDAEEARRRIKSRRGADPPPLENPDGSCPTCGGFFCDCVVTQLTVSANAEEICPFCDQTENDCQCAGRIGRRVA